MITEFGASAKFEAYGKPVYSEAVQADAIENLWHIIANTTPRVINNTSTNNTIFTNDTSANTTDNNNINDFAFIMLDDNSTLTNNTDNNNSTTNSTTNNGGSGRVVLGGVVMEWADEWWKANFADPAHENCPNLNPHVQVSYNHDTHNNNNKQQ